MCYIPATHILTTAQLTINHRSSAHMDMDINIVFGGAIGGFVACMCFLFLMCYIGGERNAARRALATQQFLEEALARERQQHQNATTVEAVVVVMPT